MKNLIKGMASVAVIGSLLLFTGCASDCSCTDCPKDCVECTNKDCKSCNK